MLYEQGSPCQGKRDLRPARCPQGQKVKKKRQEPVLEPALEPEAKPRRLRVKKLGEAGAAEEPRAPAQGKLRHPPPASMEMGGHAGPAPCCARGALHHGISQDAQG